MHRIVVAAVAAALSITGLITSPALATTAEWHVQASAPGRFDSAGLPSGAGNRFYPEAIAIHEGDSVSFLPFGPHTVTYNRPPGPIFALLDPSVATPSPATLTSTSGSVNGLIGFGPPPPYSLTFTTPVTSQIICGLTIGMPE